MRGQLCKAVYIPIQRSAVLSLQKRNRPERLGES